MSEVFDFVTNSMRPTFKFAVFSILFYVKAIQLLPIAFRPIIPFIPEHYISPQLKSTPFSLFHSLR